MKPKSILLIICSIGLSSILSAQEYAIDKKAMIISGSGSILSQGGDLYETPQNEKVTIISLSPTINYFVFKNLFVGCGIEFYTESQGKDNSNSIGIGPQIGYAFGGPQSKVIPYIDLGIRYYKTKQYYGSLIGDFKMSGSDVLFGFGVIVPVNTYIGLILEGGYQLIRLKNKEYDIGNSGNTLSIGVGIVGLLFKNSN